MTKLTEMLDELEEQPDWAATDPVVVQKLIKIIRVAVEGLERYKDLEISREKTLLECVDSATATSILTSKDFSLARKALAAIDEIVGDHG